MVSRRKSGGLLGGGVGIILAGALALYFISRWGKQRQAAKALEAARALQSVRLTF